MFRQKLRKVGNSYVVTIPKDEVERLGIAEGQLLSVQITPLETHPAMTPAIAAAFDEMWAHNEAALRYLAEH